MHDMVVRVRNINIHEFIFNFSLNDFFEIENSVRKLQKSQLPKNSCCSNKLILAENSLYTYTLNKDHTQY